jgi:hypothetical protein
MNETMVVSVADIVFVGGFGKDKGKRIRDKGGNNTLDRSVHRL